MDSDQRTLNLTSGCHLATLTCIRKPLAHEVMTLELAPSAHATGDTGVAGAADANAAVATDAPDAPLPPHMVHALHMQKPQSNFLSAAEHHDSHRVVFESPGLSDEQAVPAAGEAEAACRVTISSRQYRIALAVSDVCGVCMRLGSFCALALLVLLVGPELLGAVVRPVVCSTFKILCDTVGMRSGGFVFQKRPSKDRIGITTYGYTHLGLATPTPTWLCYNMEMMHRTFGLLGVLCDP